MASSSCAANAAVIKTMLRGGGHAKLGVRCKLDESATAGSRQSRDNNGMERLTEDLLELCVTQGGAKDLVLASAVSTTWWTLANDPRHWTRVVLARWPHLLTLPHTCSRQLYRMLARPNGVGMIPAAPPRLANPWAFLSPLQLLVEFEAKVSQHRRTFAAVLSLNDAELLRTAASLPSNLQWHCPDIRILAEPDALNPGEHHAGEWHGWMKTLALWSGQSQQMLQLVRPEDEACCDSGGAGIYHESIALTSDANENSSALEDFVVSLALTGEDLFTASHPNYHAGLIDEGDIRENAEMYRGRPCIELYISTDADREHFHVCFQSPWYMDGINALPLDIPWQVLPELIRRLA